MTSLTSTSITLPTSQGSTVRHAMHEPVDHTGILLTAAGVE